MWKKALLRAGCSMGISSMAAQVIALIIELCVGEEGYVPLMPLYLAHFNSVTIALGVSVLLTGLIGAAFGGFSIVFEIEKWSFFKQGVVHFLLTTAVWLPICIFLWGMDRYPGAMFSVMLSFVFTYVITWWMNYQRCREAISSINEKLEQMRSEENEG